MNRRKETSAARDRAPAPAADADTKHLLKAEREIAAVRWSGLLLWVLVLQYHRYDLFAPHPAWLVFGGGVLYALLLQWQLRRSFSVRVRAWSATVGDPLLAVIMCSVTGGIESVFIPFCHFTLLAAAFRFGVGAALLVLVMNGSLLIAIGLTHHAAGANIALAVANLSFSAVFGVMLAGWAHDNQRVASDRAQRLRQAHEKVRGLLQRYFRTTEEQRKQFASELHDRMGGQLFAVQQGLDTLARQTGEDPLYYQTLNQLSALVRRCTADIRALMNDLRPTVLDDFGLWEALREHILRLADREEVAVSLAIDPALAAWRSPHEALIFRLVQEALLNIRKHARARNARVDCAVDESDIVLTVSDDGIGFDPAAVASGHYGLLTMRERAEALGGQFALESAPGHGTTVRITLSAAHQP